LGFRQPSDHAMGIGLTSGYEDQTGALDEFGGRAGLFGGVSSSDAFGSTSSGIEAGYGASSQGGDMFGYGLGQGDSGGAIAQLVAGDPMSARRQNGRGLVSSSLAALPPVAATSYSDSVPNDGLGRTGRFLSGWTRSLILVRDRWFGLIATVGTLVAIGYWCFLFPNPTYIGKFTHHPNEAGKSSIVHGAMFVFIGLEFVLVRHRWAVQWW